MFCVRPGKDEGLLRLKRAHFDDRAYWDDLSTDSICRDQADPECFAGCCSKRTESHASFCVKARDTRLITYCSDNVTNSFTEARRVRVPVDPSLPSLALAHNAARSHLIHTTRSTRKLHKYHHRAHTQQPQTTDAISTRSLQAVASRRRRECASQTIKILHWRIPYRRG